MKLTEILPELHKLNRAEKFQLMQFLVSELAKEEGELLQADASYPVWSPYDANEAAHQLAELLEKHKQGADG